MKKREVASLFLIFLSFPLLRHIDSDKDEKQSKPELD